MQLEMEMKLSRKLRKRANNRKADDELNDSDMEDSDEKSESEKSETGSNITLENLWRIYGDSMETLWLSMENPPREPRRKSTGGLMPRKALYCRAGNFHKRVRETSGNCHSGPKMNKADYEP